MFEKLKLNPNWNNWHWQYDNSYHSIEDINKFIQIDNLKLNNKKNTNLCQISLTPYMLYTILNTNSENAIALLKQFILFPEYYEQIFTETDSLNENKYFVAPNLIRKHLNRVALLVNNRCACYCQFCTRKYMMRYHKKENFNITDAIDYIRENLEIIDVLITGGDPLMLETMLIDKLLDELYSIKHIKVVRIGTRLPITLPMRIDSELINILNKYPSLYINIHINHPAEITTSSKIAILSIANSGVPLGSQSVLLRGINNDVGILQKLFEQMIEIKVKPYYLYQCDKVPGCEKFIVPIDEGIKIINELNSKLSGFAVPKFIIDTSSGKLVAGPSNVMCLQDHSLLLSDYTGKQILYEV